MHADCYKDSKQEPKAWRSQDQGSKCPGGLRNKSCNSNQEKKLRKISWRKTRFDLSLENEYDFIQKLVQAKGTSGAKA